MQMVNQHSRKTNRYSSYLSSLPLSRYYSSVFTAAKAGMGGVDQQKVKQVVYEMSKV